MALSRGAYDPRHDILSHPMRLHWRGWETDTYRLQRAGWEISAAEVPYDRSLQIAIRLNDEARGLTRFRRHWDRECYHAARDQVLDLPMEVTMARSVITSWGNEMLYVMGQPVWSPIDATPQLLASTAGPIDRACRFAKMAQTAPMVVAEEDVSDLLARILEKQQPAKEAYFRNQAMEERESGLLVPKVHAQIITLGDRRVA